MRRQEHIGGRVIYLDPDLQRCAQGEWDVCAMYPVIMTPRRRLLYWLARKLYDAGKAVHTLAGR
jgi:hypothetical protein